MNVNVGEEKEVDVTEITEIKCLRGICSVRRTDSIKYKYTIYAILWKTKIESVIFRNCKCNVMPSKRRY